MFVKPLKCSSSFVSHRSHLFCHFLYVPAFFLSKKKQFTNQIMSYLIKPNLTFYQQQILFNSKIDSYYFIDNLSNFFSCLHV
jgi:hypothetical protein